MRAIAGLGVALLAVPPAAAQSAGRLSFRHDAMGTVFRIVVYAGDSAGAVEAAGNAFRRIDELEQALSDYRPNSEAMRLAATAGSGEWVEVGADLWRALEHADRLARATGGAFDVTVGPLTRLWRWAHRRATLPDADRIERARRAVGFEFVGLDTLCRRVTLTMPDMRLDFGGIGKGMAADEALAMLAAAGIERALVDAGGDVVASGSPPGREGWRIIVPTARDGALASDTLLLTHGAVATSGDQYRFVEIDGERYSHILDPATGLGLTTRRVATVVARTAAEADALATAVSVAGGIATEGLANVEGRVFELVGGKWARMY